MINKDLESKIETTIKQAKSKKHEYLSIEHILLAVLYDELGKEIIYNCGGNIGRIKTSVEEFFEEHIPKLPKNTNRYPEPTVGFQRVLQRALLHIQSSGKNEVDAGDILASIFMEEDSHAVFFLKKEHITRLDVLDYISHGISKVGTGDDSELFSSMMDREDSEKQEDGRFVSKEPLKTFTINLVDKARKGQIDPLVGREIEIERTVQILSRRRKNNPIFVGEPGVGKTAIVEGLALKIHKGKVPKLLKDAKIFLLDMGGLLAGTKYRGEFEARLKSTIEAIKEIKDAIIFIDEIHTVVGAGATSGGSMDASNILKPFLNSGQLRCIGASTYEEYKNFFEKDRALSRRFQKIELQEPTTEQTYLILKGLKGYYEKFHNVTYAENALRTAVELSSRYINDRHLPDKAIDVIDEAGALVKLDTQRKKKTVLNSDIEIVISKMAKIPPRNVSTSDIDRLKSLKDDIKAKVFGQDQAIAAIVTAIKRSRAGLAASERPIGSFLFIGPTGVGKTEVSKQLAETLGIKFIRFDMSEYMEKHAVARLIGAPPGYVGFDQGGLLTDNINKYPYSVLLLDEIEKAHPDIYNILLQVMDYATLTDNNGKKADFRNVILIMTSNAGAMEMDKSAIGFGKRSKDTASKSLDAIKKLFSPEFRNRLDDTIQFNPLDVAIMEKVVDKMINELALQLKVKKVNINLSDEARTWLADKGYDARYGARPLSRLIQTEIKTALSDELLFGSLSKGGTVRVDIKNNKIEFTYS
ncbi:ATP-dependent Clp protease ATP-binding subunit ClpA [Candidatus Magnetoovum chiemensis]|nr:ATP-dependent Clp protease ATP-binding subunit ClpA [Candidatus Magnetoovum chiemensis]